MTSTPAFVRLGPWQFPPTVVLYGRKAAGFPSSEHKGDLPKKKGRGKMRTYTKIVLTLFVIALCGTMANAGLLGVAPGFPQIAHQNNNTVTTYNASTHLYSVSSSTPTTFQLTSNPLSVTGITGTPHQVTILILVDNNGNLISGAGPNGDDDLLVTGTTTNSSVTYSSPLLKGKIKQFGWHEGGTAVDNFDFTFEVTGGSMASFYSGKYIAVTNNSEANSFNCPSDNPAGSACFHVNFSGRAKGLIGPVPGTCTGTIGDFVWHDTNRDGIQNPGEPGINGVTVWLKQGSTILATTSTATHLGQAGYYQFTGVCLGSYSVEVDASTLPPDYTPTSSFAGGDDSLDSNGSPAT